MPHVNPFITHRGRESHFDKFMRGVAASGVRCDALQCVGSEAVELRSGNWVRAVGPETWEVDDPFGAGREVGREMLQSSHYAKQVEADAAALKRSMEAALYPVGPPCAEQATLQRLEAALDRLDAVVHRLTRRVDALTDV